ncbi:MAG: hypothetical protein ACLQIK_08370 [Mycobacterium sp.]|uniref:hypothetical protein n=1 Tax=Mycobacterium sp. TaxID=1785 RepID=UPI003F9A522C
MTANGDAWWLLEANPDQFARLEHLYARQLAGTTPRRHCPDHLDSPDHPCRGCWERARRFDAWVATQ